MDELQSGGPVLAAALYLAWLWSESPALGALAMGALGAAVAPMWTLATAAAYARGARPGLVAALTNLFIPFELLAPAALGLVADRWGLGAAMGLLLAQPVGVALLAWRMRLHETAHE